jgi:hypothetical protein
MALRLTEDIRTVATAAGRFLLNVDHANIAFSRVAIEWYGKS